MFEVKKEDLKVESVIDYPVTKAAVERFININGLIYYFFGDSKVECDEGDKFEAAFGKELAETNATIDMLKNYKSFLIRKTKQPEWRKEPEEHSAAYIRWVGRSKVEKTFYGISEAQLYRAVSKLLQVNGINIADL